MEREIMKPTAENAELLSGTTKIGVEQPGKKQFGMEQSGLEPSGVEPPKAEQQCEVMNPFVDWGFKYLFGTERSKKNLLGFLNLLLNLEHKIVDLTYLNNESIPLDKEGRECIFDILCTDTNNDQYLIEIQNAQLGYIRNRMIYYACRLTNSTS